MGNECFKAGEGLRRFGGERGKTECWNVGASSCEEVKTSKKRRCQKVVRGGFPSQSDTTEGCTGKWSRGVGVLWHEKAEVEHGKAESE